MSDETIPDLSPKQIVETPPFKLPDKFRVVMTQQDPIEFCTLFSIQIVPMMKSMKFKIEIVENTRDRIVAIVQKPDSAQFKVAQAMTRFMDDTVTRIKNGEEGVFMGRFEFELNEEEKKRARGE